MSGVRPIEIDVAIHSPPPHTQNQPAKLSVTALQLLFCVCGGVPAFSHTEIIKQLLSSKLEKLSNDFRATVNSNICLHFVAFFRGQI